MLDGIEARLHELAITLPAPPSPGGNYVPARTIGNIVFLSGVVSSNASGVITGTVGLSPSWPRFAGISARSMQSSPSSASMAT